jgi:uncharacterized protein (UPF0332 family)
MPKQISLETAYEQCKSLGNLIRKQEINLDTIKSMLFIAQEDIKTVSDLKNTNDRFNTLLKLTYNIIHTLAEAILLFDKIKSQNHQCIFAHLCVNHEELKLDWTFFEKIRTKRNGISYYGQGITKDEWKELSYECELCINTLITNLNEKLRNKSTTC